MDQCDGSCSTVHKSSSIALLWLCGPCLTPWIRWQSAGSKSPVSFAVKLVQTFDLLLLVIYLGPVVTVFNSMSVECVWGGA